MRTALHFVVVVLAAAWLPLAVRADQAPATSQAPEVKAYQSALALKEPAARLEALRKVTADFPKHGMARAAETAILNLLVSSYPDRTEEILAAFDAVIAGLPATSAPDIKLARLQTTVTPLVEAGVALDRVKAVMVEAIAAMDRADYIKRTREAREKSRAALEDRRKAGTLPAALTVPTVPSDESLGIQFDRMLGAAQEVMGRIHLAAEDLSGAEREFRAAVTANPQLAKASLELSKIEQSRGNDPKALDLYLAAAATGKLKRTEEEGLAALYRKVKGDTANLERDLDRVYRERFPNPIDAPEPFAGPRGGRVALLELFTGSACGPCVSADLALEGVLERYPSDAIAVLAYHVHIPGPDPMTVPDSVTRKNLYAVPGVPTFNVDGARSRLGGGPRENAQGSYDTYIKSIDASLATAPEAEVSVTAGLDGERVNVTASVKGVKPTGKPLRLHLVLAERELTFLGENGIRHHPFVVRDAAGAEAEGLPVPDGEGSVKFTFDLSALPGVITKSLADDIARRRKAAAAGTAPREYRAEGLPMTVIDKSNLVVVAFVQEAGEKPAAAPESGSTDADDENPPPPPMTAPAPAYRVLQAVWAPVTVRR